MWSALRLTLVGVLLPTLACGREHEPNIPVPPNLDALETHVAEQIRTAAREVTAAPRDTEKWAYLGMIYEANRMSSLALDCYERAIELEPSAKWWYRDAIVCASQGELESAVAAMQRSIEARGDYAPAHWRLGNYLFDLGHFEGAERSYRRAIEVDRAFLGGWQGIARVRLQVGSPEQAVTILEGVRKANPRDPGSVRLLNTAYLQAGHAEQSAALNVRWRQNGSMGEDPWEQELNALRERTLMERALEWIETGRAEEAAALLEEFVQQEPGDLNALAYLAKSYLLSHRKDDAQRTLDEALRRDPDSLLVLRVQTLVHEDSGRSREALAILERMIRIDPYDAASWKDKGRLELIFGNTAAAVDSFRSLLELDPSDAHVWLDLARGELTLRRFEEAARAFEEAIQAKPQLGEAYLGLARTLARLERWPEAQAALLRAPVLDAGGRELLEQIRARLAEPPAAHDEDALPREPSDGE